MGLPNVLKNDFFRNVFALFKGNAIAQAITLVSIPILTRIYTPEEFGMIALFVSMVNVFAIAATGGYDLSIVLPKRNGEAFHILVGSLLIAFTLGLICFIVVWIFFTPLTGMFPDSSYKSIIWLLPLAVFLTGSHRSIYCWFNRKRAYSFMGNNRVVQNAAQTGVRLYRNGFSNGSWGLVAGYISGLALAWSMLAVQLFRKESWRLKYISFKSIQRVLREHKNFPLFLMPMGILNTFSVNLLVFGLSIITTSTTVGHYERATRVISFPLALISSSFGSVFFEKMNRTPNRKRFYLLSYFGNLALAIVILFPIAFWGEAIFAFVLGSDWRIAGKIARVIIPLTAFSYATECISTTFSVIKKNQILLIWQVVYLMLALGWLIGAKNMDIYFTLSIFSIGGSFLYAALALIGYLEIKKSITIDR